MSSEVRHISIKKDQLVVRHNNLIQAGYSTTLYQQRLLYWLISQIKMEDQQFQTYRVSVKELSLYLGVANKNIYQVIDAAAQGMIQTTVKIENPTTKRVLIVGLLSSVEYQVGEGFVDLSLDPKLRPYLLNLQSNFTKAYLGDLLAMRSVYATRVYDLLIQYAKIGKRVITIEEFRTILDLGDKYPDYYNFKSRVIIPAVRDINEFTTLDVEWEPVKRGRSVHAIEFRFKTGSRLPALAKDQEVDVDGPKMLKERLMGHGVPARQAQKFVNLYGTSDPERILDALVKTEDKIRKGEVTKSAAGFLRTAIEEDWREQKSLFQKTVKEEDAERLAGIKKEQDRIKTLDRIEAEIDRLERLYLSYRISFIRDITAALDEVTLTEWREELLVRFEGDIRIEHWNGAWDSRIILPLVEQLVLERLSKECLGLEEFLAKQEEVSMERLQSKRIQHLK
jgi:plasmid replication initiation protein